MQIIKITDKEFASSLRVTLEHDLQTGNYRRLLKSPRVDIILLQFVTMQGALPMSRLFHYVNHRDLPFIGDEAWVSAIPMSEMDNPYSSLMPNPLFSDLGKKGEDIVADMHKDTSIWNMSKWFFKFLCVGSIPVFILSAPPHGICPTYSNLLLKMCTGVELDLYEIDVLYSAWMWGMTREWKSYELWNVVDDPWEQDGFKRYYPGLSLAEVIKLHHLDEIKWQLGNI